MNNLRSGVWCLEVLHGASSRAAILMAVLTIACFAFSCVGDDDDDVIEPFPGPCVIEYDPDGNGLIDSRSVLTYDQNDLEVQRDVYADDDDNQIDEIVDVRIYTSYNDNGLIELYESDQGADGSIEDWCEYEFDANGWHSLRECYEDWGDGSELDWHTIYDYSADGKLLFERSAHWSALDDMWIDQDDIQYFYNSDGLLEREELTYNSDEDETVDRIYYHLYDPDGLPTRQNQDWDNDGEFDRYYLYTNNDDGFMIRTDYYVLPEDYLAIVETWERDDRGNPLVWSREVIDDQDFEYEYYYYDCWE